MQWSPKVVLVYAILSFTLSGQWIAAKLGVTAVSPLASDSALIIPTTIPLATALFATLIHERLTTRRLMGSRSRRLARRW
jgi:hypothetical protein